MSAIISPCVDCSHSATCTRMCYNRLEWGVFEADSEVVNLAVYGNGQISKYVKQHKSKQVTELLNDFSDIYNSMIE